MSSGLLENTELEEGISLLNKGRLDEAKIYFENQIGQGKNIPLSYFYLSLICNQWNNPDETIRHLELAINNDPEFTQARKNLLTILFNLKKWPEALAQAEFLISRDPASLSILESAAFIHRQLGQANKAREYLEKALAIAPGKLEIATALAGFVDDEWRNPWPEINPKSANRFELSALYNKFWSKIDTKSDEIQILKSLARLDNPQVGAIHLESKPDINIIDPIYKFKVDNGSITSLKGLSVFFGPTVTAGNFQRIANFMKRNGIKAETYDISPTYLNYTVDYPNKDTSLNGMGRFTDFMFSKAMQSDIICLDFGSSLKQLPFLGLDLRNEQTKNIPYPDLFYLKQKGKKILSFFWGSDCYSQAFSHYWYLKFLGIDIPKPPTQTRLQYNLISVLNKVADCLVAPPFFIMNLPRTVPFWDTCLDPGFWPKKSSYNDKVTKILTSVTSKRKKNVSILEACIMNISKKYKHNFLYHIENKPYSQVPSLYSKCDIGLEQAHGWFGLLGVEMMALGLPVVGNFKLRGFGSPRVSAPLINFNNIQDLYNKLSEIIDNPSKLSELGKTNRDFAMTYHSADIQGQALSQYINKILNNEKIDEINSDNYSKLSNMFNNDLSKSSEFLYYDVAIPIYCMLGEYEYARVDCDEAILNGYKIDKFRSFKLAISKNINQQQYEKEYKHLIDNRIAFDINLVYEYSNMLINSQKLLNESVFWLKDYQNKLA